MPVVPIAAYGMSVTGFLRIPPMGKLVSNLHSKVLSYATKIESHFLVKRVSI